MTIPIKYTALLLALVGFASCHPGNHVVSPAEIARRAALHAPAQRSLTGCQGTLGKRDGVMERGMARRKAWLHTIRESRGISLDKPLKRRDFDTVLNTSHASDLTDITNNTDSSVFYTSTSCVLAGEVTEGPYFVEGEYVRFDLRDGQTGVDLYLDVELIDVNTCEPVSDVYIDMWGTNSTGVYSGVSASGNGASDTDTSNLDATFCRGFQQTNSSGVAQFLTIFPGHYTGRTNHIHLTAASQNGTVHDNGTYTSDTVMHVGQLFFDQDIISQVEETSPYSTNSQDHMLNSEDNIMEQQSADIDPVVEYVLIGDNVSEGLFGWTSVGIDTTFAKALSVAVTLTEDGGVANENAGMGGGPPGDGGPPGSATSSSSGEVTSASGAASSENGVAPSAQLMEDWLPFVLSALLPVVARFAVW